MIKRSFYLLWGTQTVSNTADIIYLMGLISFVFGSTQSLIFTSFVPLFRMSSKILSGLMAPLVISRYKLTRILFVSQVGQFILFTSMLCYLWLVPANRSYVIIFLIVFGMSFLDGWTNPARNALVPRLASEEGLMRANGLISVSDQVVRCGGWALSGVIVAILGPLPTLTIASVCYGVAMVLTAFIRDTTAEGRKSSIHRKSMKQVPTDGSAIVSESSLHKESRWSNLTEGWILLGRNRRLRSLAIIDVFDTLGGTAWISVFLLAFIQQVLHRDESWWGIMNGSFFAGSIVGGLFVVTLVKKLQKRSYLIMLLGLSVYVLLTVLFAFTTEPLVALILLTLSGFPVQVAGVIRHTLIQESVDSTQLPKVFAAWDVVVNLTFMSSMVVLAWFADTFGMVNLYLLAALLTTISIVIGVVYRKAFKVTEVVQQDPIGLSNQVS